MNYSDLVTYTGLSKSKIYKLTRLKLIPMGNNPHIRQKFFDKDAIDAWLLGEPDLFVETLEHGFNEQLMKNQRESEDHGYETKGKKFSGHLDTEIVIYEHGGERVRENPVLRDTQFYRKQKGMLHVLTVWAQGTLVSHHLCPRSSG